MRMVRVESSRIIKPFYEGNDDDQPSTNEYVPLSVFDKVNYDTQVAVIFAYRAPTPPSATLELGLRKALSVFRPFAGRLGVDGNGDPIILLNDEGVKFVEASVDGALDETVSFEPSPSLKMLHPSTQGAEELVQVQLTRFSCGSLVVGFVSHHFVADGQATSNFLVAWGQATRGVEISPIPFLDRDIFTPRNPPQFDQFEHRGVEYMPRRDHKYSPSENQQEIAALKVRYAKDFLAKLKTEASNNIDSGKRPYSTFESLLGHVWRAITKARGLDDDVPTHVKISVNGRMRLTPSINKPNYFGNLVLWAYPTSKAKDLTNEPLSYAAKAIHDSVARVNSDYFKSFVDFASYKVREEELVPTADVTKLVLCPNVNVDSWLRFQFYELDFGSEGPFAFMPTYIPVDGLIFLLPTSPEDGSVDVVVSLFKDKLETFKQICYNLD